MRIIPYDTDNNKDRKRSRRQLRKKKESKWLAKEMTKPTKACRVGKHSECDVLDCPCHCHKI